MKRLLLVMGMVGCGGEAPPAGDATSPSPPKGSQVEVDERPAQAADADPVATLETLGVEIKRNEQGEVVTVNFDTPLVAFVNREATTDTVLVHLKGLTNLQDLNLPSQITDAGLVHLKGLTNLQDLNLMQTQITDAGLVHLKQMTNLRELWLTSTQITDSGLVHLKELTSLTMLNLSGTKVTDAGIVELQEALPDCKIIK